ncbi:UBP1-associated proteins 1C [Rhynchospora pubera]|uniref:UBP1-associated proteins 1C n=1 Tax=Rhynchospora pubera TaxID=906938 RepID=A0AAV8AL03_9POAL|nr:UBP1-associated proteins 1C [Rhynchospora pubera]
MVWFQCEDCGEELKKPKLAGHFNRCSAYKLSCIDCGVTFDQESVKGHNQCISEAEKYGPKSDGKPVKTPQSKPDKTKPNADVDINVGLSTRPPWFFCATQQQLASKPCFRMQKGRSTVPRHELFMQKNEPTGVTQEASGVPVPPTDGTTKSAETTKKSENHSNGDSKGEEKSVKRKREDQEIEGQNGHVVEAEKTEPEFEKKKKVKSAKEDGDSEIKWKKIITSILKSNADGVMKIKKLKKEVVKLLRERGITKDKDQLHDDLISKISSSSRFLVEDKYVKLVAMEN